MLSRFSLFKKQKNVKIPFPDLLALHARRANLVETHLKELCLQREENCLKQAIISVEINGFSQTLRRKFTIEGNELALGKEYFDSMSSIMDGLEKQAEALALESISQIIREKFGEEGLSFYNSLLPQSKEQLPLICAMLKKAYGEKVNPYLASLSVEDCSDEDLPPLIDIGNG